MFAEISLAAQIRLLDMREVETWTCKCPLSQFPFVLAKPCGTFKKTNKASLLHNLRVTMDLIDIINEYFALIVDGISFLQQLQLVKFRYVCWGESWSQKKEQLVTKESNHDFKEDFEWEAEDDFEWGIVISSLWSYCCIKKWGIKND